MMRKIGLTGNIGSGKTLVSKIFQTFGIPVFEADREGRQVLSSPSAGSRIVAVFGSGILSGRKIDRKKLAHIVFNDPRLLQELNNIIHPAVRERFVRWSEKQHDAPYLIYEAAVLFESGHHRMFDAVITVFADAEERIKRVMHRDNMTREMVLERMKNQWPDEQKIALSDFTINNNGTLFLTPQVEKIHKSILNMSDE